MGWIANALIVIGLWKIGDRWRHAFLFSIAGEILWSVKSLLSGQYDLAFICIVFCALAFRNWIRWGREGLEQTDSDS